MKVCHGKALDVVYLVCSEAFDTISQKILLEEMDADALYSSSKNLKLAVSRE